MLTEGAGHQRRKRQGSSLAPFSAPATGGRPPVRRTRAPGSYEEGRRSNEETWNSPSFRSPAKGRARGTASGPWLMCRTVLWCRTGRGRSSRVWLREEGEGVMAHLLPGTCLSFCLCLCLKGQMDDRVNEGKIILAFRAKPDSQYFFFTLIALVGNITVSSPPTT